MEIYRLTVEFEDRSTLEVAVEGRFLDGGPWCMRPHWTHPFTGGLIDRIQTFDADDALLARDELKRQICQLLDLSTRDEAAPLVGATA